MDSDLEFEEVISMTRSLALMLMSSTSGMSHEEVAGVGHIVEHLSHRLTKIKESKVRKEENVIWMGPKNK